MQQYKQTKSAAINAPYSPSLPHYPTVYFTDQSSSFSQSRWKDPRTPRSGGLSMFRGLMLGMGKLKIFWACADV